MAASHWTNERLTRLLVDVGNHPSDRELRATVLHEMIHVVVGRSGHTAPFWTQLEYLLKQEAPITVGFPELGEAGNHLCVIPARFRLCRRLFAPAYRRHQRALEAQFRGKDELQITADVFAQECHDAAVFHGVQWRDLWRAKGNECGFIDLDGRCLPFARKYYEAGRRGFERGRRAFLENRRAAERFEAMIPHAPTSGA